MNRLALHRLSCGLRSEELLGYWYRAIGLTLLLCSMKRLAPALALVLDGTSVPAGYIGNLAALSRLVMGS